MGSIKNNYRILVKFKVPQTRLAKMFHLTPQIDVETFTMKQNHDPTQYEIEEAAQEKDFIQADGFQVLDVRLMRRKRADIKETKN